MAPYLVAADRDPVKALELYEWSAELAGLSFQAMHYVEVVVRNSLDRVLSEHHYEVSRGIPWFLQACAPSGKAQTAIDTQVERVRDRLRKVSPRRDTRDQIVAGLDFGFWTSLLHTDYDQLWRDAIRKAFPHSPGRRSDVVSLLEALRLFRNRLAHHDSLLNVDVLLRVGQMGTVMGWVDPAAGKWLQNISARIVALNAQRPVQRLDTVVVAAARAYDLYLQCGAYVCQPGRTFRPVSYLAFYNRQQIETEITQILWHLDDVPWTNAYANHLAASGNADDADLASVITTSHAVLDERNQPVWHGGRYQVFKLTLPAEKNHLTIPLPVLHLPRGRGSAFTQKQRYVSRDALAAASDTASL